MDGQSGAAHPAADLPLEFLNGLNGIRCCEERREAACVDLLRGTLAVPLKKVRRTQEDRIDASQAPQQTVSLVVYPQFMFDSRIDIRYKCFVESGTTHPYVLLMKRTTTSAAQTSLLPASSVGLLRCHAK